VYAVKPVVKSVELSVDVLAVGLAQQPVEKLMVEPADWPVDKRAVTAVRVLVETPVVNPVDLILPTV